MVRLGAALRGLCVGVLAGGAAISLAQSQVTATFGAPGQAIPAGNGGNPFAGSLPSKVLPRVLPLSFADAIAFSLLPPENATGNYVKIVQRIPVKIVLDPGENRDRRLRPGMNVVPDVYLQ